MQANVEYFDIILLCMHDSPLLFSSFFGFEIKYVPSPMHSYTFSIENHLGALLVEYPPLSFDLKLGVCFTFSTTISLCKLPSF